MWISRKELEHLRAERDKCWSECRVLAEQNVGLRNTVEWLCAHVTRVEHERAVLVQNYMGISLPTRELSAPRAQAKPAAEVPMDIPAVLGMPSMFQDVGDEAARTLGLDWDGTGKLVTPSDKK